MSRTGELADRMLGALECAEDCGGDFRGKRSAALLVVSTTNVEPEDNGVIYDIRVDESNSPLSELRRIFEVGRATSRWGKALGLIDSRPTHNGVIKEALTHLSEATKMMGKISQSTEWMEFWVAIRLIDAQQIDSARSIMRALFKKNPEWQELLDRLIVDGQVRSDVSLEIHKD